VPVKRGMTYDAPAAYADLIGPRYAPIAAALVEAAGLRPDDDVLELGAGTGLVTKRVAPSVRSLVATDASAQMLERARSALRRKGNVTYALLDYSRPFPLLDASFSLVLSGLTFVQDSSAALGEIARVLRRRGRLALSMWGPSYHEKRLLNAARESLNDGRFPSAAPGQAVRRLERAGFGSIARTDIPLSNRFRSVDDYLAYRRGFGRPMIWSHTFYERFLDAVRREATANAAADGSFELGWTVSVITARRPR
jgi:SAM-dependent methyltransferase